MEDILKIASDVIGSFNLLITLLLIYWALFIGKKPNLFKKIIAGLTIGFFTIVIMITSPWHLGDNIQIDTRTIYLSVAGTFFGPVPTFLGAAIAIVYRIFYIGGIGAYSGTATIIFSASFGVYWHKIRKVMPKVNTYLSYYIFSVLVHIGTLVFFLLVPERGLEIFKQSALIILILYPLIGLFLGSVLGIFKRQFQQKEIISRQRTFLGYTLDAPATTEILSIDLNYKYLTANRFHINQMKAFYGIDIKRGMNYLSCIKFPEMKKRIEENIKLAIAGENKKIILEVEVKEGKFLEESYLAMYDEHKNLIGVAITSEDITERVMQQRKLEELSYRDSLTHAYNRRHYTELLTKLDKVVNLPLTIVFIDINGLKLMNDAFGHDAGDELLQVVAKSLTEKFAYYGDVSRTGGDEFAVIIKNLSKQKAEAVVENIIQEINSLEVRNMKVSVSYGLDTKTAYENINTIIRQAEDNMYTNKLYERHSHRNDVIQAILRTLREKNPEDEAHSKRVAEISTHIGKKLKLDKQNLKMLEMISNLHDIGKIGISNSILQKPGKLTNEEWEEIKKHPEVGYRILLTSPSYATIAEDILSHHERYDGKGYPRRLKGNDIPIRARIIAVADAYDAMTSERPYRGPMSHEEAVTEIKNNSGTQFDPDIVEAFLKCCK